VDHTVGLIGLDKVTITISVIKSTLKKWDRHMEGMGFNRNTCRVLMGKLEGKRQLRKHRSG
jgi:hypothetical protein